jgi:ribosomal protein L7/L12
MIDGVSMRAWMAVMDTWLYLAVVVAIMIALTRLPTSAQRRRTETRLANVERKIELIMGHFGIEDPEPSLPEVIACLEQGKKIHAVRAYRDGTGAGLKEAKDAVERIARDRGLEIR